MQVNYKLYIYAFNSYWTRQCPTHSADMVCSVVANSTKSELGSANIAQYQQTRCRTEIGEWAFLYDGPHTWNALPPSLHNTTDSKEFRKQLKCYYFFAGFCENVMQAWPIYQGRQYKSLYYYYCTQFKNCNVNFKQNCIK